MNVTDPLIPSRSSWRGGYTGLKVHICLGLSITFCKQTSQSVCIKRVNFPRAE
jgi:hypothetical protein